MQEYLGQFDLVIDQIKYYLIKFGIIALITLSACILLKFILLKLPNMKHKTDKWELAADEEQYIFQKKL